DARWLMDGDSCLDLGRRAQSSEIVSEVAARVCRCGCRGARKVRDGRAAGLVHATGSGKDCHVALHTQALFEIGSEWPVKSMKTAGTAVLTRRSRDAGEPLLCHEVAAILHGAGSASLSEHAGKVLLRFEPPGNRHIQDTAFRRAQ